MTCDGYDDCGDMTDETDCKDTGSGSNPLMTSSFECTTQPELVDKSYRCNGIPDCHDGSDEENCDTCSKGTVLCEGVGCMPCGTTVCSPDQKKTNALENKTTEQVSSKIKLIELDGFGLITQKMTDSIDACPESYFLCGRGTTKYCIPTFLVGNGPA
ncbi:hypothetical protein BaRGS_00037218 [Batillaria attramentaria]|uniref:Uncharacterized protein n=1 Tax=Batillaria attramentaria TaxID=370345 RepID=A0ABD0J9M5_9CAEN